MPSDPPCPQEPAEPRQQSRPIIAHGAPRVGSSRSARPLHPAPKRGNPGTADPVVGRGVPAWSGGQPRPRVDRTTVRVVAVASAASGLLSGRCLFGADAGGPQWSYVAAY